MTSMTQSLGDVASLEWRKCRDPNAAALLKEEVERRDLQQAEEKAKVAAEQAEHSAFVHARYEAYIATPEGKAWLARVNRTPTYKGHRKQTFGQQVRNQMVRQ